MNTLRFCDNWIKSLRFIQKFPACSTIRRIGRSDDYDGVFFAHRARAAARAISDRCSLVSFLARAMPPFRPPNRPSSTAAAFLTWGGCCWSGAGSATGGPGMDSRASFVSGGFLLERLRIELNYRYCGWFATNK